MANLPEMSFGHIGINVADMEPMVKFYTEILGFKLTDRGKGGGANGPELVFLSRDPEEHHQIVLVGDEATRRTQHDQSNFIQGQRSFGSSGRLR